MNINKLVKNGINKLKLEKPIKLIEKKEPIKLSAGVIARATMQAFENKHVLTIDSTKKDFLLKYKINHELCHAKLNEMGIQKIIQYTSEIENGTPKAVYKFETLVRLVYEYYADSLCADVFDIPQKLINGYNTVFSMAEGLKEIFDQSELGFYLQTIGLFLLDTKYENINVDGFFTALQKFNPELVPWVKELYGFVQNLPQLPNALNEGFIGTIARMILKIYKSNPL